MAELVTIEIMKTKNLDQRLQYISHKINTDIGFYWWRRYIYSAFWSVVSTPINLSITVFTALTTGQTSTSGSLISNDLTTILGIVTLLLSVINTFFRPGQQLITNQNSKEKWRDLGVEFEEVYYSLAFTDEEKQIKLEKYHDLFERSTVLKKGSETNYLIDLIYICARKCCLKRKELFWLPDMRDKDRQTSSSKNGSEPGLQSKNRTAEQSNPDHLTLKESVV